jgi:t-SNARE complex subunit (syntaxin)
MISWGRNEEGRSVDFVDFEARMKQISVWPMLILLIVVVLLVVWLGGVGR